MAADTFADFPAQRHCGNRPSCDCRRPGRRCSALLCVVIADHTSGRIHEYRVAFDIKPFPESIETSILRPQRWIGVPPLEFGFEQLPVISPDPPFECGTCICVFIAYPVNGSFFVRSLQCDGTVSITGIRSVDPRDSRTLVSKNYCRTIDHSAFSRITTTKLCAGRGMARILRTQWTEWHVIGLGVYFLDTVVCSFQLASLVELEGGG